MKVKPVRKIRVGDIVVGENKKRYLLVHNNCITSFPYGFLDVEIMTIVNSWRTLDNINDRREISNDIGIIGVIPMEKILITKRR
jgi:hypothetical protein